MHEPVVEDVASLQSLADWLQQQKVGGRVRYLGLAGRAENCVAVMQQFDGLFDVLQVEDSLKDVRLMSYSPLGGQCR